MAYTILLNQTAIHGVPAALNAANTALLRAFTGNANASMRVTNYPLPTVSNEDAVKVSQMSGKLPGLLLLVTMPECLAASQGFTTYIAKCTLLSKFVLRPTWQTVSMTASCRRPADGAVCDDGVRCAGGILRGVPGAGGREPLQACPGMPEHLVMLLVPSAADVRGIPDEQTQGQPLKWS